MSYLVLARKYRPHNFSEMVGQEHVVQALSNALTTQRLHHMLLPHHFSEVARTVFASQNKIGHVEILRVSYNSPRRAFPHGKAANRVRWGTKQL